MSVMKKVIIFGIIIALVLCIILLYCTTRKSQFADTNPVTRLLLTTDVWRENAEIEQYLCILEMFDRNDVDTAKKRIQELLYIRIMIPPQWELTDSPDVLKAKRLELLKRIKKYHEQHKDEIDMELPSNKRAVKQFEGL